MRRLDRHVDLRYRRALLTPPTEATGALDYC